MKRRTLKHLRPKKQLEQHLYGYSRKPTRIFLMGQGYMFFSKAAFTWREFQKIWMPKGNGLVCWGRG